MDIEKSVITRAALVYKKDPSELSLATDIREELSSQSIKLISFVSALEEEFEIIIEFHEAGALKTIGDFVNKIKQSI